MPEFYGTISDADQYHASRGNAAWALATTDMKTQALVRASQYIDGMNGQPISGRVGCRLIFPGQKSGGRSQILAWPRTGAFDREGQSVPDDTVPKEIEWASYESGLLELANPGYLTPTFTASSLVKSEKVGPLETVYAVSENSGSTAVAPIVPTINSLLYSLLITRCGGTAVFVV